jgi:transcription-repair coupling factor (superfamily II helicase)
MNPAPGETSQSEAELLEQFLAGVCLNPGMEAFASGRQKRLCVAGLRGSAPAFAMASLYRRRGGRWLVVTPDLSSAEALADDLECWLGELVHYIPELEILPFDRKSPTRELAATVQSMLDRLQRGENGIFVTTVYALRHRVMSKQTLRDATITLKVGQEIDTDEIGERLAGLGYRPGGVVEMPGDMALRGGLLDIWSPAHDLPLRIELQGDEIDGIRSFEPVDQRSREELDEARVLPAAPFVLNDDTLLEALARIEAMEELSEDDRTELIERLQDRLHFSGIEGLAPFFHAQVSLLDYFEHSDPLVWLSPDELHERSELLDEEALRVRAQRIERGDPVPAIDELMAPRSEFVEANSWRPTLWLGELVIAGSVDAPYGPSAETALAQLKITTQQRGNGQLSQLIAQSAAAREGAAFPVLFCDNRGQAERLSELIEEEDEALRVQAPRLLVGHQSAGFVWPEAAIAVFTDHELFDRYRKRARRTKFRGTGKVADPNALRPGDHCVHVDHGIGKFLGLRVITAEGIESECLLIGYAGGDRLYVPTEKLLLIERYDIPEGSQVELHKLGGATWERTKKRAKKAIQMMAAELLELYAVRAALPGHAFPSDTHLQRELEDSFLYEETPDQLSAAIAVKRDMEQPRPTDRLVCGDVGFGKTEVAMRAAFKAVMGGKQVAVLCPTTILAEQHGDTFSQRMRDYPVNVAVLSRFKSSKEQKEILRRCKAGGIDILIGTHRLLSRDVAFKELGLLVVDEEQRFGVRHKERFKEMRRQVDVLTMTATPIPRTLYLSLMGARDMSIIATPPRDRLPIFTEVVPFSEETIRDALLREMHRGGQTFFVHNRVETISAMANMVRQIVPSARVITAHGQMHEGELEGIMRDFVGGEYDVMVTTTIIESGLDMPNVNTLIIDRADRFGLSQLYQLRGRVGRSRHQAYAYLMIPKDMTLNRDARQRLSAITEFTDLGSGYHIAMRDLEIRGAGNILGDNQHGHITAIGFDLYCKLLEEEIRQLKGDGLPRLADVKAEMKLPAYLPDDYMADPEVKLRWYRELGRVEDEAHLDALAAELRDRFGPFPEPVSHLIGITRLKLRALIGGITEIRTVRRGVRVLFGGERQPDSAILEHLIGTGEPPLTFNAVERLEMTVETDRKQALSAALVVLGRLYEAVRQSSASASA